MKACEIAVWSWMKAPYADWLDFVMVGLLQKRSPGLLKSGPYAWVQTLIEQLKKTSTGLMVNHDLGIAGKRFLIHAVGEILCNPRKIHVKDRREGMGSSLHQPVLHSRKGNVTICYALSGVTVGGAMIIRTTAAFFEQRTSRFFRFRK